jgi:hypothetical protein
MGYLPRENLADGFPVNALSSSIVLTPANFAAKSWSRLGVFAFWVAALIRWYEATLA